MEAYSDRFPKTIQVGTFDIDIDINVDIDNINLILILISMLILILILISMLILILILDQKVSGGFNIPTSFPKQFKLLPLILILILMLILILILILILMLILILILILDQKVSGRGLFRPVAQNNSSWSEASLLLPDIGHLSDVEKREIQTFDLSCFCKI